MATLLDGKEVGKSINERTAKKAEELKAKGVVPCLATFRVGEAADQISYETGATKRCKELGVDVRNVILPEDISQDEVNAEIEKLNQDDAVHGVLILSPFPKALDWEITRAALDPKKDMDGITDGSYAKVFSGVGEGYAPCTPAGCMEILDHYDIDPRGKNAVVVGRSLIVGKPAAMMLLEKNATVTIAHTKTENLPEVVKAADIVLVAAGVPEFYDAQYFSEGQIVIDVGINWSEEKNKLVGDVDFDSVEPIVGQITPVPGGVGSVTTSKLVSNVVDAAEKTLA